MITHDLGRAFYHRIKVVRETPLVHFTQTRQARWPFWWSHSLVIRTLDDNALVLGWWRRAPKGLNEEELLIRSINGRVVEDKRSPEVQRAVYVREMTAEEVAHEVEQAAGVRAF